MHSIGQKYRLLGGLRLIWLASLVVLFAQARLISHSSTDAHLQFQKAIHSKRSEKLATDADTYETTASTERSSTFNNVVLY